MYLYTVVYTFQNNTITIVFRGLTGRDMPTYERINIHMIDSGHRLNRPRMVLQVETVMIRDAT